MPPQVRPGVGGADRSQSLGGDQWAGERLPRAERTLTSVAGEEVAGQTRGSRTLTRVWGAASVRGRRPKSPGGITAGRQTLLQVPRAEGTPA